VLPATVFEQRISMRTVGFLAAVSPYSHGKQAYGCWQAKCNDGFRTADFGGGSS